MRSHVLARVDLDQERLSHDLRYLADTPRIEEEYDEFSSGYWKNISLRNASGEDDDTAYRDLTGAAAPTRHSRNTPYLHELVGSIFDESLIKMVRARNLVDAMVVPHRDFVELDKDNDCYFRTFMVLEDNPQAFHSDEESVIRMRPGEIWFLDAAAVHSAVNFSARSRQSICVDFAFEGSSFDESAIFADKSVYNRDLGIEQPARKPFTAQRREALLALCDVIDRDNFKDVLFLLSKVHYRYDVAAGDTYEWLIDICRKSPHPELVGKAEQLRQYMIGDRGLSERFTINSWAA